MPHTQKSTISSHTEGTSRGEEVLRLKGPEPCRENGHPHRAGFNQHQSKGPGPD